MDIRQLIYFATIVEEGSISAAAKKLHLSQPPLSYQLKLLEEELHLQLLQRGARGVQLTEAGKVLYKRAQGILELTERTQKELQAMAGRLCRHAAHRHRLLVGGVAPGLAHPGLSRAVPADRLCHPRGQHLRADGDAGIGTH